MLKRTLRVTRDVAPWRAGHASLVAAQWLDRGRNERAGCTYRDHLAAAAAWIGRAQDAAPDGGVIGRYRLRGGWTSSYPETTGYLVPTMLQLAQATADPAWLDRARRAVAFLLRVQLPQGAFPGGEVHENRDQASVFNTAQILHGLQAWHAHSGDERVLEAGHRAAEWLVSVQGNDGCFRDHIYNGLVTTYSTHASCWLGEFGHSTGETRYLEAAERHMDWALQHRDPQTGWIDLMGFTAEDHQARQSVTHTIAYTLWGILATAELKNREDAIAAVTRAAEGILRRVEIAGWLPGRLDCTWRAASTYSCLTGNAQLALLLLRLHARSGDPRMLNTALKLLDLVRRAQPMDNPDPGIRGGIAGSFPVWGDYLYAAYPNWAAKYFVDALLAAEHALSLVRARKAAPFTLPPDLPRSLPLAHVEGTEPRLRIVLLASPRVHKVAQMVTVWSDLGVRPAVVVVEAPPPPSIRDRLAKRLTEEGWGPIWRRLTLRRSTEVNPAAGDAEGWELDVRAVCERERIPVVEAGLLSSEAGVEAVRQTSPDILVHAGAGLLRAHLLALPRIGTINAHMGILPWFRGMNATEWSFYSRAPIGGTVHRIDPGIDTGEILCVREVDPAGTQSLGELRRRVDAAQITLLGEVLEWAVQTGTLPPGRAQVIQEGRQYYRMHPQLRAILDEELGQSRRGCL